ncbi:uncharacterized protein [Amphiura filiformis]|uniref:uncharacterized protein n=1 Tax=Amphiura filiformis TaxID=82378 RepID=UPI003B228653
MADITNIWDNIQPFFKDRMPVGEDVLRQLVEKGILSGREQSDVQDKPDRKSKREELLEILKEKPSETFYEFVGFVRSDKRYKDIYQKFVSLDSSLGAEHQPSQPSSQPRNKHGGGAATTKDFRDVIKQLTHDELRQLYIELDISAKDISDAELSVAPSRDVQALAMAVFGGWQQSKPSEATRQTLLKALEECKFINAKQQLEEKWN